jgi:hypothetical protein
MNRKDIALTVGGVVATMVLAYLLYRMQQRDAAAYAAAAAAANQANQDAASSPVAYQADPYAEAIASLSTGSNVPATGATPPASMASSVASSSAPDTNPYDETGINDVLSQIISDFGPAIMAQGASPESVASMTIPTMSGVQSDALSGVPITAADATAASSDPGLVLHAGMNNNPVAGGVMFNPTTGVVTPLSGAPPYQVDPGTFGWEPPAQMQTGADVSSHPVTAHPIIQQGAS